MKTTEQITRAALDAARIARMFEGLTRLSEFLNGVADMSTIADEAEKRFHQAKEALVAVEEKEAELNRSIATLLARKAEAEDEIKASFERANKEIEALRAAAAAEQAVAADEFRAKIAELDSELQAKREALAELSNKVFSKAAELNALEDRIERAKAAALAAFRGA